MLSIIFIIRRDSPATVYTVGFGKELENTGDTDNASTTFMKGLATSIVFNLPIWITICQQNDIPIRWGTRRKVFQ